MLVFRSSADGMLDPEEAAACLATAWTATRCAVLAKPEAWSRARTSPELVLPPVRFFWIVIDALLASAVEFVMLGEGKSEVAEEQTMD